MISESLILIASRSENESRFWVELPDAAFTFDIFSGSFDFTSLLFVARYRSG